MMTRDEVDKAFEPQLDIWVATHVMRWTVQTSSDGHFWWTTTQGLEVAPHLWSPSTAIGDAWKALEALPEDWVIRKVSRVSDGPPPRRYSCRLYRGEARRTADVWVQGPSPALAITRAVLHASLLTVTS